MADMGERQEFLANVIEHWRQSGKTEFTHEDVDRAMGAGGFTVTPSWVWSELEQMSHSQKVRRRASKPGHWMVLGAVSQTSRDT